MVIGCRVMNKSYVENGPIFVLHLDGQVEPVTVSKDLVKYLHNHQFKSPSIFKLFHTCTSKDVFRSVSTKDLLTKINIFTSCHRAERQCKK